MKYIGAHVSTSGGVENALKNAINIGAKAFAMFLKNQRQWASKPYTDKNINEFKSNLAESDISADQVLPHDGYLINLGNSDNEKREKSVNAFIDEAKRVEQLGLKLLNFHPGSHLKEISEEECLDLIVDSLNKAIDAVPNVVYVVENTAGQGTNLGYKFEHLAYLIENVNDKSRIGVCLDTCHTFTSGYDLRTKDVFDKTFEEFEKIVGFKYLRGMHLNDSKIECGKKVDRHEAIGKGFIGLDFFKFLMNDERFDDIPMVLETPNSENWDEEIKLLYSLVK
jgi:deoxyribonuclease IV